MSLASFYLTIRDLHIGCAVTSLILFTGRGAWVVLFRRRLARSLRVLPHVVDTVLLASGLTLAFLVHQYPFFNSDWLSAKVAGLVVYVALGTLVFRGPRSRAVRGFAGLAAIAVFGYIVSVAMTKQPAGFLYPWL